MKRSSIGFRFVLCSLLLSIELTLGFTVRLAHTAGTQCVLTDFAILDHGYLIPISVLTSATNLNCYYSSNPCDIGITNGHSASIEINTNGLYFDEIVYNALSGCSGHEISVIRDEMVIYKGVGVSDNGEYVYDLGNITKKHFPFSLVDIFLYNGEFVAPFRIQYLYEVVDKFIIIESRQPFSSANNNSNSFKKNLYIEDPAFQSAIAPFLSKIQFIVVQSWPDMPPEWMDNRPAWMAPESAEAFWRENYQRECAKSLIDPAIKTVFICSDVDEIPNKNTVRLLRDEELYNNLSTPMHLSMILFMFNFNWRTDQYWQRAYVVNTEGFLRINNTVLVRSPNTPGRLPDQYIESAGWHLSAFGSIDYIIRKIESFAHMEFNRDEFKKVEHVKQCVKEGRDIYGRDHEVVFVRHDGSSPENQIPMPEGWEVLQKELLKIQQQYVD